MPRISPAARVAAAWRSGGEKPGPPQGMSPQARRIWQEIVADRPADWFRPGSLQLLRQFCEVSVAQHAALADLTAAPDDDDVVARVKTLAGILNATSIKLRLSVQADVDRRSRRVDEREASADVLLGGWKQPA
jgi:hypothetical protein